MITDLLVWCGQKSDVSFWDIAPENRRSIPLNSLKFCIYSVAKRGGRRGKSTMAEQKAVIGILSKCDIVHSCPPLCELWLTLILI